MPELKYDLDQDLKEAQAMADVLDPYIYEDQLYRRIGGGRVFSSSNMPYMTLGALLLRLRRLRILSDQLPAAGQNQLAEIEARNADIQREWSVHYERKLVSEALSRLDAMRMFFDECDQNPQQCASAYLPEALRRTIVEEVQIKMDELHIASAEVKAKRAEIDHRLRGVVKPAEFIWAEALKPAYSPDRFWWLYGKPQSGS